MKKSITLILAIIVTSILLGTTTFSNAETNHIPSPREQVDDGISPSNVVCKQGLKLVIRANSNSAACVMNSSYERILQIGWAKSVLEFKDKPQPTNNGEVKTIRTTPLYFDTGIRESKPEIVTSYNYVFEACAKSSMIRSPEVLIISDSETKSVLLSENIPAGSCQTSTAIVKATDTNSIKASLVKKGDLSIIVSGLESKVSSLKEKLAKEKNDLGKLVRQDPVPADLNKLISEKTAKITELRNELDVARADLQKNQYVLILSLSEPSPVQAKQMNKVILPQEITPINYPHVNKIKTAPQFVDAGRLKSDPVASSYNFVFEVCTGDVSIVYPEVMIKSDSEVKSIKLSESLDSFECQISSTSIKAGDQNSISGTMITTGDISKIIHELESKVVFLQENISNDKKSLGMLVTQNPDDLEQQISILTEKIVSQRNELIKLKHDLISIKYMVNE